MDAICISSTLFFSWIAYFRGRGWVDLLEAGERQEDLVLPQTLTLFDLTCFPK
jgi:hypothetical protein